MLPESDDSRINPVRVEIWQRVIYRKLLNRNVVIHEV